MKLLNLFRAKTTPEAQSRPQASVGQLFDGLDDPDLLAFMRNGGGTASGAYVTASKALQNMALLRCVTLISESIGMLPLNLIERGDEKKYATTHPLYRLLKSRPNQWQTAYEFKSLMQLRLLLHGNAYARIIRSRDQIIQLIPIDPALVTPKLDDQWNMQYHYQRKNGETLILPASEIFHLRDLSDDGIVGLSRVKLAREAIGIALQAEKAAARLFKNGVMAGGALSSPDKLSDEAYTKLQASVEAKAGADNAGRWMILEEGLKAEQFANTAADAQHIENRNHQIEEIARAMGVPRPLLMMDDTSWGSGIEQLGIFFVQYSLQHWFTVWEQATERSLLTPEECGKYFIKFNERALLRGTLKDQADFFTKALGSGGQQPFMTANQVRELLDMSKDKSKHADELGTPLIKDKNVTTNPAKN
ncbi:phage portal protein [Solimicrobium silvestre]|uniref:Phage portal protein, HK97 family n=1 Tax=Solimicrobium silvestre TaxID=2099400 RepID=A0A2S9GZB5_9BURK|nr:phage portal protein [Solimicrobium silvestre]PRC93079.1 Phage portal protein, HK97 family [Solimicrobium silvestre]